MHTVYANPALNTLAAALAEPFVLYGLAVFVGVIVSALIADFLF